MVCYTVRRDDDRIRLVTCPSCSGKHITDTREMLPLRSNEDNWLLRLFRCDGCGVHFTFDIEDGVKPIDPLAADYAAEHGMVDRQKDGRDSHGHMQYVTFLAKPPTMSVERYDQLCGFTDGGPLITTEDDRRKFEIWRNSLPSMTRLLHMAPVYGLLLHPANDRPYPKGAVDQWFTWKD